MSEVEPKGFVKLVSFGQIDLEFTLVVNKSDFKKFKIPTPNEINSNLDLKNFLFFQEDVEKTEDKINILDLIRVTTSNSTLNSLLFLNRAFEKKTFIEFLILSNLNFTEEEEFIKRIIKYVTEQNYIFLIESSICEMASKIKFTIKYEGNRSECFYIKTFYFESVGNENIKNSDKPLYEALSYNFELCDYFYLDLNNMLQFSNYGLGMENLNEFIKNLAESNLQTNIIVDFPNLLERTSSLNLNSIAVISEIIKFTDIFIFERKEALALFNVLCYISEEKNEKEEKKNIELIFLKEIKKKRKNFPKIGLFFDELKKLTIIEQQTKSNLVLFHSDFEFDLIPKNVGPTIQEEYKKLHSIYYSNLKSIFLGGFFSRIFNKKSFKTCFTAGSESAKRIVEIYRFDLDFPNDPNFFVVKIKKPKRDKSNQNKNVDQFNIKKEQHFLLDCINLKTSKMNMYNPIYDHNLQSYFKSIHTRKHLKKLGFINKKGEILQDPDYKKLAIIKNNKLFKLYENEQNNLIKIKDNNYKMKLQINNLFHGATQDFKSLNLTELEKLANVYNFHPLSGRKLPSIDKSSSLTASNDLYAKVIAENKKDHILNKYATKEKFNVKKNLKPLSKENYLKMLDSIEGENKKKVKNDSSKTNTYYLTPSSQNIVKLEQKNKNSEGEYDFSSNNQKLEFSNTSSSIKGSPKESKIVNISIRSSEKTNTDREKENSDTKSKIENSPDNDKLSSITVQKQNLSSNLLENDAETGGKNQNNFQKQNLSSNSLENNTEIGGEHHNNIQKQDETSNLLENNSEIDGKNQNEIQNYQNEEKVFNL